METRHRRFSNTWLGQTPWTRDTARCWRVPRTDDARLRPLDARVVAFDNRESNYPCPAPRIADDAEVHSTPAARTTACNRAGISSRFVPCRLIPLHTMLAVASVGIDDAKCGCRRNALEYVDPPIPTNRSHQAQCFVPHALVANRRKQVMPGP